MTGQSENTIPILRFSTDNLPTDTRYKAWLLRDWPRRQDIYITEPTEPFSTRWESAQLGDVMFVYTEITAMRWERRASDILSSDFDPIIINMMVSGTAHGDMDGRAFVETSGEMHFHDLGRRSLHSSTASTTYSIVLPRPLAQCHFGSLQDLHGLVIRQPQTEMLFAHAELTRRALPRLDQSTAARLGRVFIELAAIMLAEARPDPALQMTPEAALIQRAEAAIERRLGDGAMSVTDLCQTLNVSRARLFRAFRSQGGIQNHIAAARLDRARAALGEIDRAELISNVAHRFGFSDAAHLSRAFRQRYGMTPREYRQMIANNRVVTTPE